MRNKLALVLLCLLLIVPMNTVSAATEVSSNAEDNAVTREEAIAEIEAEDGDWFNKLSEDLIELYILGRMSGTVNYENSIFLLSMEKFTNFKEFLEIGQLSNQIITPNYQSTRYGNDHFIKDFTGIEYFKNLYNLNLILECEPIDFSALEKIQSENLYINYSIRRESSLFYGYYTNFYDEETDRMFIDNFKSLTEALNKRENKSYINVGSITPVSSVYKLENELFEIVKYYNDREKVKIGIMAAHPGVNQFVNVVSKTEDYVTLSHTFSEHLKHNSQELVELQLEFEVKPVELIIDEEVQIPDDLRLTKMPNTISMTFTREDYDEVMSMGEQYQNLDYFRFNNKNSFALLRRYYASDYYDDYMPYASINLVGKQERNVIAFFPQIIGNPNVTVSGDIPEDFIEHNGPFAREYLYFYDEPSIKGVPELELTYPGYTLVGWYDTLNNKMVDLENDLIEGSVYLKAMWAQDSIYDEHFANITYANIDNTDSFSQKLLKGSSVSEPTDPTKEDYTFLGWSASDSVDDLWNFNTPVYEDLTLYAQWRKSFNEFIFVNGNEQQTVKVPYDHQVTEEQIPEVTKDGYRFKEWNTQADGTGNTFDFSQIITENKTVYAIYEKLMEPLQVQIKFIDGESIITETIDINTVFKINNLPENENEDFLGWNTEEDGTGTFITEDIFIKGNTNLYAIYENKEMEPTPVPTPDPTPKPEIPDVAPEIPDVTPDPDSKPETPDDILEYEIEFIDGNHIIYESVEANTHLEAEEIPEPFNDDLIFKGWNFSADGTGEYFSSDTIISEDITLYAIYDTNNIVLPSTGIRSMMLPLASLITLMGCMTLIVSIKPKKDSNL